MSTAESDLRRHLADCRRDWRARLALADVLEEADRTAESLLERSAAWRWAWAEALAGHGLCFVEGMGRRPLVAHFRNDPPTGRPEWGWELPNYLENASPPPDSVRVVFEAPGHDVPADLGRRRRYARLSADRINRGECPWLIPTRHDEYEPEMGNPPRCAVYRGGTIEPGAAVMTGASVAEFCVAVEAAGGWWVPDLAPGGR